MKRAPALQSLSREHQHALAIAFRLRRADAASAAADARAFLEFWEDEGREHFREEEEVLLPAYAEHGDPAHPLVVRALVEHVAIRQRARALGRRPDGAEPEALRALGTMLGSHVRGEERELFPLIEEALPPAALAELAAELDGAGEP